MEYEKMLERAYMNIPKQALAKERFEMPVLESHVQGNKTIVKNFSQVVKVINREERHLLKFLNKELAAPITLSDGKLNINGKFSNEQLNVLFKNYVKEFVLCFECQKPDTRMVDQQGVKVLKCDACGAIHPLKRL